MTRWSAPPTASTARGFRPGTSQAFLAKLGTWVETHTDQLIIWGGLILGFWLIGKSIYLIAG